VAVMLRDQLELTLTDERGEAGDNLPACRPSCTFCGVALELRGGYDGQTGNGWTSEQRACGVWYDHPPVQFGSLIGHTGTALLPRSAASIT
jgi:hypothetical protein